MKRAALLALSLTLGCSSGGSDGTSVDGGARVDSRVSATRDGGTAQGTMSWKYDGTLHVADTITATRMKNATLDFLEVIGAQASGDGLAMVISDLDPNDAVVVTGTYDCPGTNVLALELTYNLTGSDSPMSCTIAITQPGMAGTQNAIGTFEAILSNGKAITEGQFDTPIGTVIHLP